MIPSFLAGVLEGFEGTIAVVLERLGESDLRRKVEELQAHLASKRQQCEAMDASEPGAVAS
jgi:hypothetical protein